MIRRGQTTTLQERLEIGERAAAGQSDPEIAAGLGCSVWTVRKWRRRGQHQGRIGLNSHIPRVAQRGIFCRSHAFLPQISLLKDV